MSTSSFIRSSPTAGAIGLDEVGDLLEPALRVSSNVCDLSGNPIVRDVHGVQPAFQREQLANVEEILEGLGLEIEADGQNLGGRAHSRVGPSIRRKYTVLYPKKNFL